MLFLNDSDIDLEISDMYKNQMLEIINDPRISEGSQINRFPILEPKSNDKNNLILAISTPNDKAIGRISLENIDYINMTAELKIFLKNEFQGLGFSKKAAKLIIKHAFKQLNMNRIYLGTLENNQAMMGLAESLGFVLEGVRRKAVFKNGSYLNVVEYGLLKEDYNAIQQ